DKINPKYKRLIELRFFKEYSYDEIAVELELPLGTVKAQLFRAKELLYNILKGTRSNY
ncbi:MAG: RNA polymerase sigma factor (sigma-70 family), partial [Limisphaerales bacterium]